MQLTKYFIESIKMIKTELKLLKGLFNLILKYIHLEIENVSHTPQNDEKI